LLKSPVNAARLRDAIADADAAVNQVHKHVDSLSEAP
jgi:hypothetical protein